jgi:uncharacterized protein
MATVAAEALRELHRIHRQLADLKYRLEHGPRKLQASANTVTRAEQQLADLQLACKKMRLQSDEQQAQLKYRESKIADLERRLNECKTNTEFTLLKNQIAAERQANAVLEDEILDKLERVDVLQAQIQAARTHEANARQELQKMQQRVEKEHPVLQSELERVTEALNRAERALPGEFRPEYDRLVRAHGPDCLAPVEGETCGNCNTVLTSQTMNELYLSRTVFCKSCGCVLYLPEARLPS